ncbi:MAG: hypothetical protein FJ318_06035 [SAR202 cluster bacterium]|nr:hypothetical protein [SAR202 cluster bacterium]
MQLAYVGPTTNPPPLPEGWPAAAHDEPDAALAKAKLAHRAKPGGEVCYRRAAAPNDEEE